MPAKTKPRTTVRRPPSPAAEASPEPAEELMKSFVVGKAPPAAPPPSEGTPSDKRVVVLKSGERRRVNFLLPPELVKRVRRLCADRDLDMTGAVTEALEVYVKNAGY